MGNRERQEVPIVSQPATERPSLIAPWTPAELVTLIKPSLDFPKVANDVKISLVSSIYDYHNHQGLLTEGVTQSLRLLQDDAAILRFAHQPNFLPEANILGQILYLDHARSLLDDTGCSVVSLVFLIDHDVAGNERFRRAEVWDPAVSGHVRKFELPLNAVNRSKAVYTLEGPDSSYEVSITRQMADYLGTLRHTSKSSDIRDIDEVVSDLGLNRRSVSLTAYTSYACMRAILVKWNLPVLFCPISSLHGALADCYESTLQAIESAERHDAGFWYVCDVCGRRRNSLVNVSENGCRGCRIDSAEIQHMRSNGWRSSTGRLIPRVTLDDIVDYNCLGVAGGTSYLRGREHLISSHAAAAELDLPVAPEASWRVTAVFDGPMERLALRTYGGTEGARPSLAHARWLLAQGRQGMPYYVSSSHGLEKLRSALHEIFLRPRMIDDNYSYESEALLGLMNRPPDDSEENRAGLAARPAVEPDN